jgi:predicted nucleotidyltransferase
MIAERDKSLVKSISKKYRAKRVVLFGSSVDPSRESHDIDIAVEGVPPADFFRYYGELIFALSKPVDIVDLAAKSKFVRLALREGELLYG